MSETKPHIDTAERVQRGMDAMMDALNLIYAINNRFMVELQKFPPLAPEDEDRIAEWSRGVAKSHEPVERARSATAGPGGALPRFKFPRLTKNKAASEAGTKAQPRWVRAKQAKRILEAQGTALNLVVATNNRFIADMQKSTTLRPEDRARIEEWSRAVAKAQEPVERAFTMLDRPGSAGKLN